MTPKKSRSPANKVNEMRVLSVLALVVAPFVLRSGIAPLLYLASGAVSGVLYLFGLLYARRRHSKYLPGIMFGSMFLIIPLCEHFLLHLSSLQVPQVFFYQWMLVFVIFPSGIMSTFGYCLLRLSNPDQATQRVEGVSTASPTQRP